MDEKGERIEKYIFAVTKVNDIIITMYYSIQQELSGRINL